MYKREDISTVQQTFIMGSPRMIISLALVLSLALALIDARPRAKRQTAIDNGCQGGDIHNDLGTIQIGDGVSYGNNEDCCFTFNVPPYLAIGPVEVELQFEYFDVEDHSQCDYDRVTYENSNGRVDRDCGIHNNYTRNFRTDRWFQLCFHSDNTETGRGVKFQYFIFPAIPDDFSFSTTGFPVQNLTVEPTGHSNFTFPNHNATSWTTSPSNFTFPDHNVTYLTTIPSNNTYPDHNVTVIPTMPPNNTCNLNLTGLRGHFSSPGYNQSYPNRQDCNTTIAGPSSNYTLSVTFRAFDIEDGSNCRYDYLQLVWSGNSSRKACGHQWRNSTKEYNITGGNVVTVFHSDGSVTRGGFHATYVITVHVPPTTPAPNTTVAPITMMPNNTCNQYLTGLRGHFSSPGYNQSYPNRQDCNTTIAGPSSNYTLSVTFRAFDIEDDNTCRYDYLQLVWSGNSSRKACGHQWRNSTKEYNITGGNVVAVFHSDGSVTMGGFHATYVITVHMPPTTPAPNTTVAPITMMPNNTCNKYLTGLRGHFSSPGYNQSYPNRQDCNTTIAGPSSNYTLSVTFRAFDIEDDNTCRYDYLQLVWSGNSSRKACGHMWRNSTKEYNITGGNVVAVFHSDGSVTMGGFHATYVITVHVPPTTPAPNTTVAPITMMPNNTCNQYLTGLRGHFSSPGYNQSYPNRQDCNTTIAGPSSNYTLSVTFRAFDIEDGSNCRYDYLQLVWSGNSSRKACGHMWRNSTKEYNITGGNVVAVFHSDGSVTRGGFHATYVITVPTPPTPPAPNTTVLPTTMMPNTTGYTGCSYITNNPAGEYTLQTGSNGLYSSNEECIINLQGPSLPHDTVLNFTHFDLEQEARCGFDYLNVVVGSRIEDRLCGRLNSFSKTYNNSGNLTLTFTSDYSVQKTGFTFKYSHHIKYCNATINGTSGSFATPPGGYQNNEVCFYTILTPTPVDLHFTFSKFDIENESTCRWDSLTMGDDKLCGTSTESRSYPSNGTFVMQLTTDGSVTKGGFHMDFTSTPLV